MAGGRTHTWRRRRDNNTVLLSASVRRPRLYSARHIHAACVHTGASARALTAVQLLRQYDNELRVGRFRSPLLFGNDRAPGYTSLLRYCRHTRRQLSPGEPGNRTEKEREKLRSPSPNDSSPKVGGGNRARVHDTPVRVALCLPYLYRDATAAGLLC